MADTLVHEGCHVKQAHDLRSFFMSKSARECHTAAIDALKKIGAPQELIDWDQDIIDRYTADDFCWRFITTVSNSEIIVCAYCKKPILAREAYVYHPTIERIYYLYSPPRVCQMRYWGKLFQGKEQSSK
jgi:hypothetical protein